MIIIQNGNGFELSSHGHTLKLIDDSIQYHFIASACLCKKNTHWKDNAGLKQFYQIVSKCLEKKKDRHFDVNYELVYCLQTRWNNNNNYSTIEF